MSERGNREFAIYKLEYQKYSFDIGAWGRMAGDTPRVGLIEGQFPVRWNLTELHFTEVDAYYSAQWLHLNGMDCIVICRASGNFPGFLELTDGAVEALKTLDNYGKYL